MRTPRADLDRRLRELSTVSGRPILGLLHDRGAIIAIGEDATADTGVKA